VDEALNKVVANTSTLIWTHPVGAGANLLMVGISIRDGNQFVQGPVTYAGVNMSLIGVQNGPGDVNRVEMWYLLDPPQGTANIVADLSGGARVVGGSISYRGVSPSVPLGPFQAAAGSGSTAQVSNIVSASNEEIIDTLAVNGDANAVSPGPGQDDQWSDKTGTSGGDIIGAGSTKPGSALASSSWTLQTAKPWVMGAVSIRPAC
jgi:hypothetical protein